jgi:hypothetical protein
VEEIQTGSKKAGVPPAQRAKLAHQDMKKVLATVTVDQSDFAFDANDYDEDFVLIATYRSKGEPEIRAVVRSDAAVTTARMAHYSAHRARHSLQKYLRRHIPLSPATLLPLRRPLRRRVGAYDHAEGQLERYYPLMGRFAGDPRMIQTDNGLARDKSGRFSRGVAERMRGVIFTQQERLQWAPEPDCDSIILAGRGWEEVTAWEASKASTSQPAHMAASPCTSGSSKTRSAT